MRGRLKRSVDYLPKRSSRSSFPLELSTTVFLLLFLSFGFSYEGYKSIRAEGDLSTNFVLHPKNVTKRKRSR